MTYMHAAGLRLAGVADGFAIRHHRADADARAAFTCATEGLVAYRRDAMADIDAALAACPDMAAAHALKGLALALAARADTFDAAKACLAQAQAARPITTDERALVDALHTTLTRGYTAAADRLDAHMATSPCQLLMVKLSTMLRFIGGDGAGMRRTTCRALAHWEIEQPGYSYVLGCHAFALEETGAFADAERFGRLAVAIEPRDPWAVHAVAHVLEMTKQPQRGVAWIDACRPGWTDCNNFAYHLAWHQALFHLEQGNNEAVLAVYDRAIRPDASEDNRDMANAISLLWRLRQDGVAVGARWAELAEIAHRRRHDTTQVFAALHRLLALVAIGDAAAAQDTLDALAQSARTGTGEQADVAACVGLPVARAILALLPAQPATLAPLDRIATRLPAIGGSHAQRDVFMRILVRLATQCRDPATLARLVATRRQLMRDDRFIRAVGW